MSSLITLTESEFRMAWNEFKITIKKYSSSILGTLAVADLLFIIFLYQFSLAMPLEETQVIFSALIESIEADADIFIAVLNFWLLYKLSKGFFSPNLASMFKKSDVSLLFPSPARPAEIFFSKYMKRTFLSLTKGIFILAHVLLISFLFHLSSARVALEFFTIVLFKEIGNLLEYLTFFLKGKVLGGKFRPFKVLLLVLFCVTVLLVPLYSKTLRPLLSFLPSVISLQMLLLFTKNTQTLWMFLSLLVLYLLMIFIVSLSAKKDYYEEIDSRLSESSPGKWLTFCRNLIQWNRIRFSDPTLIMALKDLLLDLRDVKIVLWIMLEYLGLVAIYLSKNIILNIEVLQNVDFQFVLINIMLWVSSSVVFPSILCFAKEKNTIYILKCAPIPTKKIVTEKYFYSLFSSALVTTPIILSAVAIFGIQPLLVTGFTVCFLVISNGVAVMIGSYYPQFSDSSSFVPIRLFAVFYSVTFLTTIIIPSVLYPLRQDLTFFLAAIVFSIYIWVSVKLCLKKALEGLQLCFYQSFL